MHKLSAASNKVLQDDSELLYMTMIGMVVAAIFAAGLHEDVDRTVTRWAPAGSTYPFPAQTRLPAAKFIAAIGGFIIGVFFWTAMGKLRWGGIKLLLQYRDWLKNPRSTKTKAWFFTLSNLLPKKKFLYTFQHVLPKYPLPLLNSTCHKMLQIIEPLVDQDEFKSIKKDMNSFEKCDGMKLQKILQTRYETELNWVADLWDKHAYLSSRSPLCELLCEIVKGFSNLISKTSNNTNFCNQGGIKKADISAVTQQSQCSRAAAMVYHYMKFYKLIESRTIPPLLVNDLVPICTYRYRFVFACSRLPGAVIDEMKTYEGSKHIIVIRKGVMFRLDIIAPDQHGEESILSGPELKKIFKRILKDTATLAHTEWNPSVFTAQNRKLWAQEREKLLSNPLNKTSLHDVETAAFHLVLEDSSPESLATEAHINLCGDGFSRWFDKSLTVTVYENGRAGGNVEHTTADATLTSRLLEYVWSNSKYDENGDPYTPDALPHPNLPSPSKIEWDLTQFKTEIPLHLQHFCTTFKNNLDIHVLELKEGKGAIKKFRISPDSFVQMALQLAFYRMHKFVPKTYESAMTRFFKYGRTETIRTVSTHSVAFTKAMDDDSCSKTEVIGHLKKAMAQHHHNKLEAMNGQGADRHMFGLYVASKMAGIKPKLFEHKVLSDYDHLSTSQSPYFYDKELSDRMDLYPAGGTFAPQREDGYGVYYLFLGDNFMTIHVTSYNSCPDTSSKLFASQLVQAMHDMKQLFNP